MESFLFERCFIWWIYQKAKDAGLNHTTFALLAFKESESPPNTWRAVRNGNKGKFRLLTLQDAINMCDALGIELETALWQVRQEIKNGWTIAQDISNLSEKAGRPTKAVC